MINISSIFYRSLTYRLSLDKLFGSKAYTMGRKGLYTGVLISLVLRAFFRRIRNICDAKEAENISGCRVLALFGRTMVEN